MLRILRTFQTKKYFSALFDSDTPKNIGYNYLSTDGNESDVIFDGLKVIDYAAFELRLAWELLKYYNSTSVNTSATILDIPILLNTNIMDTPIHFAPAFANIGNFQLSFIAQGVDLWNNDTNDTCASQILSYKRTGGIYNTVAPLLASLNITAATSSPETETGYGTVLVGDVLDTQTWTTDEQTETLESAAVGAPSYESDLTSMSLVSGFATTSDVNNRLATTVYNSWLCEAGGRGYCWLCRGI